MKTRLHLKGGFNDKLEYLVRTVEVKDSQIKISQPKSVKLVELITVDPSRKRQLDQPVPEQERSELRSLLGPLQWLCQQTRLDITVAVNKIAQRFTTAVVKDLLDCNAIAKRVLEPRDLGLTINRGTFDFKNYIVISFGDAAFASGDGVQPQCGEIT